MLINEFWKIPFLRFILPFISGILVTSSFEINQIFLISLSVLFIGLSFVYRPFLNHDQSYHKRWIFGLLISLSLFSAGATLTSYRVQFSDNIIKAQNIIGIVNEPPKETEKAVKIELKVSEYQLDNVWFSEKQKILVYLEKDSIAQSLRYGDMLLLNGGLKVVRNSGNPNEFDYKKYLSRKQIYFQTYQKASQWQKLSSNKGNLIYSMAYSIRSKVLETYHKTGISGDEFAILAALTLGVKDYLSDEIVEAYSDSGAMHVLAVSGLHVGIIMMVLNQILFFLRKNRYLIIIQSIIIIISIWFFALITGLAPSVTRASLMFTFFIIGKNSGRKPSSYNSLAASAFIILAYNPLVLFQVGFQLSYLAVFSILFFQPRIYRIFDIRNKIPDKLWQITTVSIAAQIGTIPISVFYFHQFPIYALLTNLIAIPAAFLIMCGALVLLFSGFYTPLAKLVATILSFIIEYFNKSTSFIESLPFASIEFISLSRLELLFLYLALGLILVLLLTKNKKLVFVFFFLCIVTFSLRNYRYVRELNSKRFVVFNSGRKSSFATISNKKMTLYADSVLYNSKKSINYLTSNIMTSGFISNLELIKLGKTCANLKTPFPAKFIQNDSLKIVFLAGDLERFSSGRKMNVDFIVFSKDASLNVAAIKSLFNFQKLIIDSSVSKWKQKILKKDCELAQISFYNVSESGAFIWTLNSSF